MNRQDSGCDFGRSPRHYSLASRAGLRTPFRRRTIRGSCRNVLPLPSSLLKLHHDTCETVGRRSSGASLSASSEASHLRSHPHLTVPVWPERGVGHVHNPFHVGFNIPTGGSHGRQRSSLRTVSPRACHICAPGNAARYAPHHNGMVCAISGLGILHSSTHPPLRSDACT